MKLKLLAGKRDLVKDSSVKDNYLILKGILSASLLNSNPIVREKSRDERGYHCWVQREAENEIVSVSFGVSYLKGRS